MATEPMVIGICRMGPSAASALDCWSAVMMPSEAPKSTVPAVIWLMPPPEPMPW